MSTAELKREVIRPVDEDNWHAERALDITSTEISSLFDISPYLTKFELWHRKKAGLIVRSEENERTSWGKRLQDAIAAGIAEDQSWKVARIDDYIRIPELRIGSSFDFEILADDDGLLEVKNVDFIAFRDGWSVEKFEDGQKEIEAPAHIELQLQHQLLVKPKKFGAIGALIAGNHPTVLRRKPVQGIQDAIVTKVEAFWKSIRDNNPPEPNFEADSGFISKLYGYAEPGKYLDARGNIDLNLLALEYKRLGDQEKEAKSGRDAIKAQILMQIGDHEKVTHDAFSISCGIVQSCKVEYTREPYRNFRITWKKPKELK